MANKLYKPLLIDSIKAEENLEKQRFIGFDGRHCTAGAKALGICDVETEKDQYAPVAILGVLLIQAGGDIDVGDKITSDATGKAVKVTTTEEINGYALDSAESGEVIRIARGI